MLTREGLPVPALGPENEPFLAGARESQLLLAHCRSCGQLMAPPIAGECRHCLSEDLEWVAHPGTGSVFSYIRYFKPWVKGFEPYMPYTVAIIELDDGPRFVSDIVTSDGEAVSVGQRVTVRFEARDQEFVPVFVPSTSGSV